MCHSLLLDRRNTRNRERKFELGRKVGAGGELGGGGGGGEDGTGDDSDDLFRFNIHIGLQSIAGEGAK